MPHAACRMPRTASMLSCIRIASSHRGAIPADVDTLPETCRATTLGSRGRSVSRMKSGHAPAHRAAPAASRKRMIARKMEERPPDNDAPRGTKTCACATPTWTLPQQLRQSRCSDPVCLVGRCSDFHLSLPIDSMRLPRCFQAETPARFAPWPAQEGSGRTSVPCHQAHLLAQGRR